MFPIQDQFAVATKANVEANLAMYAALASKTLESLEKLFNLNVAAAKASMEESTAATRQILSAKDPQEFLSLVSAQTKPNFEKAIAYGGHLVTITSNAQAEFGKAAEAQIAEASRKFTELVEQASQNAPAGSENVLAFVKSAFGNMSNGYEQFTRTAKQAFDANLNTAANQASQFSTVAAKS